MYEPPALQFHAHGKCRIALGLKCIHKCTFYRVFGWILGSGVALSAAQQERGTHQRCFRRTNGTTGDCLRRQ